jgi:hypothetical protein
MLFVDLDLDLDLVLDWWGGVIGVAALGLAECGQ